MKKKSRIELDREILSSVKKEMDRPRLSASVREDLEAAALLAAKEQVARDAKA